MTGEERKLLMIYCVLGLMICDDRGGEEPTYDILCVRFDDKC